MKMYSLEIALALAEEDGNSLLFQIRHSHLSNLQELSYSALRTVEVAIYRYFQ
jgi:hypothetical protein